ncbi:uncharacterised protein [Saccharolobus solfataricus]|uniref:Uncharacterized protein n=1 Tax=Saccharolobus solfataricus TaxID=2287 RepID=A0A157T649_SACSO|nr:uncharacterised protein [Saccharolobus solfataricus]
MREISISFLMPNDKHIIMKTGKDGEYYYVELDKEEIIKLKEIVKKKAKDRKPSYEIPSSK